MWAVRVRGRSARDTRAVVPGVLLALALATVSCASSDGSGSSDGSDGPDGEARGEGAGDRAGGATEPADEPDCTPERPAEPGSERRSFEHGGVEREYELTIPPAYDGSTAVPLLLSLHGFTSTIDGQDAVSDFPTAAPERGYAVVTPQALPVDVPLGPGGTEAPLWNIIPAFAGVTPPSGTERPTAEDDFGFLTSLVDTLTSDELCVDADRVYVSGFSADAGMTTMLLCSDDDHFAAAAPVAGVNLTVSCEPPRPIPVIAFHGDADPLVPYAGGSIFGFDLGLPGVEERVAAIAAAGGCDPAPAEEPAGEPAVAGVRHLTWDCPDGMGAELYTVVGGGHDWPGSGTGGIVATDLLLDFFDAHPRQAAAAGAA